MADNGNGNGLSGLPSWVVAVSKFGLIPCMLAYMIYIMSTSVAQNTADTRSLLQQHIGQSAAMEHNLQQQTIAFDVLIQLQKYNCLHNSHSSNERSECIEASKR